MAQVGEANKGESGAAASRFARFFSLEQSPGLQAQKEGDSARQLPSSLAQVGHHYADSATLH